MSKTHGRKGDAPDEARASARITRRTVITGASALGAIAAIRIVAGVARAAADSSPSQPATAVSGSIAPDFRARSTPRALFRQIPGFLSARQLELSHSAWRESMRRLTLAESALNRLSRNDADAADYAAMKAQQLDAANAALLHELYFRNLTAMRSTASPGEIAARLGAHFGSFEAWRGDFIACARVAGQWAILAADPYDSRWHNLALGAQDLGGLAGATPLLVCDLRSDAYAIDYNNRAAYVSRFFDHIAWDSVAARYRGA